MTPIPERSALQPERTALAWQRTAVTALLVLVPLVLVSLRIGLPVLAALASVAMAVSGVLVLAVRRRLVQLGDDERVYSPYRPMLQVAVVTTAGAAGGAALGLVVWLR